MSLSPKLFCPQCLSSSTYKLNRCLALYVTRYIPQRQSTFDAPKRPSLTVLDAKTTYAEGRENQMIFSKEYIPPHVQPEWHANQLKYRLERMDCLRRRKVLNIPEFYPGSIVRVKYADSCAPENSHRFTGRCIYRDGFGLGCKFALRNVIDGDGVEMVFHLFSPVIQNMEVLQLEKWLDTDLRYLRDADPSVCTIDPDMPAKATLPQTEELPVFEGKVKMNRMPGWKWRYSKYWPRPYNAFLEEHMIQETVIEHERFQNLQSWQKFDICRHQDLTELKKDIMKEMQDNLKRIKIADSNSSYGDDSKT